MGKFKISDFIGKKFGRLTIIKEEKPFNYKYKFKHVRYRVLCKCDCGNKKIIDFDSVRRGLSKSCGCYAKEVAKIKATKHGLSKQENGKKHPDYCIWTKLKSRCYNPKDKSYKNYGGRGIKICDRWKDSFQNFITDMGYRESIEYSIERIDFNKDYEPSNCKWILKSEQPKNTRRVKMIYYKGENKCLSDWCRELNLKYSIMRHRIYDLNIPFEIAIEAPKFSNMKKFKQPEYE